MPEHRRWCFARHTDRSPVSTAVFGVRFTAVFVLRAVPTDGNAGALPVVFRPSHGP